MSQFLVDVLKGLSAPEKYLESKYFYDAAGDAIFQQIMDCPEYYPTKCELEIFSNQTQELASVFTNRFQSFDIVELGAGDATKSIYLLKELVDRETNFTYYPVDISTNVIDQLHKKLPPQLPALKLKGLNGEYFEMLEEAKQQSNNIKVVLFLGSNIGNIPLNKAEDFFRQLRSHLQPGDLVLIGFDLKKNPLVILAAYNDKAGYTRDFNLNLLKRINKDLGGDFAVENFKHYPTYDPHTGTCKSYLVSTTKQQVHIEQSTFYLEEGETIHTEISQKFSVEQTNTFALNSGFEPLHHFFDSKKWFLDAIWRCV
ncbi:MAG: Methyltransferase [Segetibacter sp.]|nr:Methyltransferase [Segetibacter sp.]